MIVNIFFFSSLRLWIISPAHSSVEKHPWVSIHTRSRWYIVSNSRKYYKKTTRESHKKRGKRQKIVSIHTSRADRLEPFKKHALWFWFLMKSGSKRSICRDCLAWSIISCSLTIKENLPPLKELQKFCCEHFCSFCLTEEKLWYIS